MEIKNILGAMTTIAMMTWGMSASAVTCTALSAATDPDATLTHSTGCGAGSDGNDEAADLDLLLGGTWTLVDRDNDSTGAGAGGLRSTGNGTALGDWAFNAAGYADYVLVIKDGKPGGQPDNIRWFWFTVDLTAGCAIGSFSGLFNYCGNWTMYDNKSISHLSLYGRGTSSGSTGSTGSTGQVPEPGTMALLGLGLVGLGFLRRRKQSA